MDAETDLFAALSSPVRRQILGLLRDRAMSAGEVSAQVAVAKPTLSGHLKILRAAGLIDMEARGTTRIYRINLTVAEDALSGLMELFRLGAPRREGPELKHNWAKS